MQDLWSIGDVPVGTIEITPETDPTGYEAATAAIVGPGIPAQPLLATIDQDTATVTVSWPDGFAFTAAGLHRIQVTLTGPGPARRRVANEPIIVEDPDSGWYTIDEARADWREATRIQSDLRLFDLLESARADCLAYATSAQRRAPRPVPTAWKQAQLAQVIDRYSAALATGADDGLAGEGIAIPWRPLERRVKQLLRPATRNPRSIR